MKKISDFNSSTEKYPVVYAGSATRPEFVDMPTTLQQQEGVAPMDTLPAQWWNAMWKLATKDINAFRDYVGDAITEINNLLTEFNITLDDADTEQLYDFFHDTYVQNYLSTIFLSKNGGTIDGDLHIKGDLSVDGIGEEIISTELKVGANTITLRNDNPSSLGNTELAGVVTKNYDGNNHNNIIAINKNGEARTGDIDIATRILYSNDGTNFFTDEDLTISATIGATEEVRDTGNQTSGGVEIYEGITYSNDDTEPLLTRAEASQLPNGIALVWDATNKRAVGGSSSGSSVIPTSTTVINNIPIANNSAIKVMFTADISDTNTPGGVTPLAITYNGVSVPVKAIKNGALIDVLAKEVQTNIWKYLQAYTTLELIYQSDYDGQGNPAFIISDNPILLSSSDYTIYANGQIGDGNIGDIKSGMWTTAPYGWLLCDGATYDTTKYSKLYDILGTNKLPDLRECVLVGAGQSDNDYDASTNPNGIHAHDVYTVGQFKDDQLQEHEHALNCYIINTSASGGGYIAYGSNGAGPSNYINATTIKNGRSGTTTHGKQVGVNYCIKAL